MDVSRNWLIGTSGIALPVPNKSAYPPEFKDRSRLAFYSSIFNSIEINSTFRKLPQVRTVERWMMEVPSFFKFTFKAPETVTHAPQLAFDANALKSFMEMVNVATSKKGCLLFQFPGQLDASYNGQLKKLLKATHRSTWKKVFEFRHPTWYTNDTDKLLHDFNTVRVIHDFNSSKLPALQYTDADTYYLRLHGPEKGYRGSYKQDFLQSQAEKIRSWLSNNKTVYAYFNNTLGHAAQNAMFLNECMRDREMQG
jgi:uncharacterized protein YecE (DUF72 family)